MNDFLKTNTPEVWTREVSRVEEFTEIEKAMMRASMENDYPKQLKLARWMLRLQMEVMEQKIKQEDGKTTTLFGMHTDTFQNLKNTIIVLEQQYGSTMKGYADPVAKRNAEQEQRDLELQIQDLLDHLFHNNTVLGLNYKKKNDPMKAAYS